jgi:biotin carboxylase
MPFVLYITPFFSDNAARNIAAAVALPGVRLGVISQAPLEELAAEVRPRLAGHWRVDDALDTAQLRGAAEGLARDHGAIHRLISAQEQLQVQIAEVREHLGIPGMRPEAARNFRDKARMKDVLRAAGVPCARHQLAASEADAWRFAEAIGYPLVLKPPAGAGSQATYQIEGPEALASALASAKPAPGRETLLEEFITGEEHSFDTISLGGRHLWHSLTHYLPAPLDAMRNPWIQWSVLLPREIDGPQYDDIRQIAFRALDALGMETGLSHLEWFRRRDGSIAISEVAARPPGAQITTLMSRANDFDAIAAWTRLLIFDTFDPPQRRYAVGAAFLRGQGRGVVRAVHGLEQIQREVGHLVTDAKLPTPGQAPSPSYEGEGYIVVRHPETAVVRDALARIVGTVRVELG